MADHFPLMPRIYMAIAQEDRFPIADIMRQTPDIPADCQWALFLRNHDELTLEMVTDVERDYLWSTYANDPRARINVGIRRRLAPLMDNDRRKIELMNSLLLSFPGTPIIYYGDEIGMGDNIYLGDRNGVRTPMQWTPDRNGGFSRADPARLYAPTLMDPVYGYEAVNVEAQSRSLSLLARTRGVFERDVLPGHLARTRWYPERSSASIHPTLTGALPFCDIGDNRPYLTFFETTQRSVKARYVLPMRIEWVRFDREHYNPKAFAAVRQGAREGTLLDVATDQIFIGLLLRNLREKLTVEEGDLGLQLEFRPTGKFAEKTIREPKQIRVIENDKLSSSALVDDDYFVKIYRKLESGTHPEIDMGRFLTEVAGFANTPALLGSVELVEGEQRSAIGIVNAFVMNQGDAWTVSAAYLDRFVDEQRLLSSGGDAAESEEQISYLRYMSQAGRRLAEMHVALAGGKDVPDFEPVAVTPEDFEFWIDDVMACVSRVFDAFRQPRRVFSEADRPLINQLLAEHAGLPDRLRALLPRDIDCLNIRHHGNLHLGQLLIVKDDIFIIDFEGDSERSIAERRRKAPAARDVAG